MQTTAITGTQLVDRALYELQDYTGIGVQAVIASDDLATAGDTTLTIVAGPSVNISDVIEFGTELVLITNKTTDATPVYTAQRGYYGTTAVAHAAGVVGTVNPRWPRIRVFEAIRRSYRAIEALNILTTVTTTGFIVADTRFLNPNVESIKDLLSVTYMDSQGRPWEIPNCDLIRFPPTATYTAPVIRVPFFIAEDDALTYTYSMPVTYPVSEVDSQTVPVAAQDLPAIWASAWLVGAREIKRADLEVSTEWNQGEPQRGGVSLSLAKSKWQEFYRQADECKRSLAIDLPIIRPYRRVQRF